MIKKLEQFLFYLFIFSIPFQIRKVLFSPTGNFVEWNSGFLYFTDLLLIGIFVLWIWRTKPSFVTKPGFVRFWLIGFFVIAALSLIVSQNIGLSIYQLIKLAEFILLFLYIKNNLNSLKINRILNIIIVSGVLQALLAIIQFFNQSSLGLKHFEAGIFNANIPGVATFFVDGVKFIRAYGTTPHPNVLAVFLLAAIFCIYALWLNNAKTRLWQTCLVINYGLLILGLLLTFSRAVILIFIASSLLFFLIAFIKFKKIRFKIITLFLLFIVFCSLFTALLWPEVSARFLSISSQEQAVTLRLYYNDIALSIIKEKPLLGLGLGNFVWHLFDNYQLKEFWLYQPVHNLYLLIAVEIGIIGLIVFLIFLGKILFKRLKQIFKQSIVLIFFCLLLAFLALSMIDHYFWTIQQSRLIFWLFLAFIAKIKT